MIKIPEAACIGRITNKEGKRYAALYLCLNENKSLPKGIPAVKIALQRIPVPYGYGNLRPEGVGKRGDSK
jgi:hypothetical protein